MSKLWQLVVLSALPLFLAGCIPFGIGQGGIVGAGEFLKGTMVQGFPSVPIYPKARIGESFGDGKSYGVYWISGDKLDKVVNFYLLNLRKSGWENTLKQSGSSYVFDIRNPKYVGTIIVNTAADGKSTAITVSVTSRSPVP